jgi:crotonobetainyl-CoA:carnitine CoA-transferase CaiB-like acyl-CoA transferase
MLDTMISFLWPEAMTHYTVVGREASTADPNSGPDLIFEAADDYITVGTVSDSEWRGFCAAAERPDLVEDPRFSVIPLRCDQLRAAPDPRNSVTACATASGCSNSRKCAARGRSTTRTRSPHCSRSAYPFPGSATSSSSP